MQKTTSCQLKNLEELKLPQNPKILIIGGGYGGLKVALGLQKLVSFSSNNKPEITLISKHDYHYQTTLLHKVAIGTLSPRKARIYYRKLLDPKKVRFIKDKIINLSPNERCVYGNGGRYDYDVLVITLGFKPDSFGIKGVKEHSFKLSSLNRALKLSQHIEHKFKDYIHSKNPDDLSVVVCGTGFTSIEFAAELASQIEELCLICGIDKKIPKITCIGRSDRILPVFDTKLSQKAVKKLEDMGVKLITKGNVKEVCKNGVIIERNGKDEFIKANTILWGAGVKGSDIIEKSSIPNRKGRIEVDRQLRCFDYPEIFVVGDSACPTTKDAIHAPTAQLSAQMGDFVARMLSQKLKGKSFTESFSFKHRGTVCSIGHTDGVGIVYGKNVSGEFAAFMKNTIENRWLFSLGGFPMVFRKGQFRYRSSN
ncbi:NAD(P)/FAD-dependent oxidoreductase [Campylobacter sp. MIT 12-8780]|uniref:NAD(P)/FAD-dependent oxidoreductase n=1 Tax=Campylobacter sp. MIT 12-8780 TaxID=2202200 RepID=UPI00115F1827|nr:NAD(P)/FAD-dependent oxidoreductase [Campylobacter sp. MIT 12-8780]TQR41918.1 NAD(P)/FAD-dependent oxidoreductase [Campylobacter sp. MIT 12-8780]